MEFHRKKIISFISLIFILLTLIWTGCRGNKTDDPSANINKGAILANITQEIILKRYEELNASIIQLEKDHNTFIGLTNNNNLLALRTSYFNTYLLWEKCSAFEFGPAEMNSLKVMMNTFPCDTAQIHANLKLESYDLYQAQNIDATGLPSLDYMLYGIAKSDSEFLIFYSDSTHASNRLSYVSAIIEQMKTLVTNVYGSWSVSGTYYTGFVENLGTDVGSSLSLIVNGLNKDYEMLKNAKIGIPMGKKTLDIPLPHKTEDYYSGRSMELALQHMKSLKQLYAGINDEGIDGMGIDDYIKGLESEGVISELNETILNRFTNIESMMETIPDPLSESIINEPSMLNELYNELVKQVVSLKTDMPSAMGVLISYQDNDGD